MHRILFVVSIVFYGCGDPPQGYITDCPRPPADFTWFRVKNIDAAKIYVRYSARPSGDLIGNVSAMQLDSILPGSRDSFALRTDNDNFNHYYFFQDRTTAQQIGKLVLKNTQPAIFGIADVELRITGSFRQSDSYLTVSSLVSNRSYCARFIQLYDWQRWKFNYRSPDNESGSTSAINCTAVLRLPTLVETDKYQHLYFHTNYGNCNDPIENEEARIIYRNTSLTKIFIPRIYVLD